MCETKAVICVLVSTHIGEIGYFKMSDVSVTILPILNLFFPGASIDPCQQKGWNKMQIL